MVSKKELKIEVLKKEHDRLAGIMADMPRVKPSDVDSIKAIQLIIGKMLKISADIDELEKS